MQMSSSWKSATRSPSLGYSSASSDESPASPDASTFLADGLCTIDPKQILQDLEDEDVTQYLATSICDYNIWNGCKTVSPLVHPRWEEPSRAVSDHGLGIHKSPLILKKSKAIERWCSGVASCSGLIDLKHVTKESECKEMKEGEESQDEDCKEDDCDDEYEERPKKNLKKKTARSILNISMGCKRGRKRQRVELDVNFDCGKCEKIFKRQEHLRRHFRSVHTTDKPYKCSRCPKTFSRSDNLAQHVRVHSKNRFF